MDLIIDTSSDKLKLILNNNSQILESFETNQKHLKHLLPEIENILTKANKKLDDINTFSVVVGPGSFTGVRIGVSTVKAFGCVLKNKKYIPINMLDLLNFVINSKQKIKDYCIIIKSTSTKFYLAFVQNSQIKEMKLVTNLELQQYKLPLFSYNCAGFNDVPSSNIELVTDDYLKFNEFKKNKKDYITITELKPIYLALSQAEEELNKRLANENKNN